MTRNASEVDATTLEADDSLIEPLRKKLLHEFSTEVVDKELNDEALSRYLVARNNDFDKTFKMAKGAIQWRLEKKPEEIIVSDFKTANEQGSWRFAGYAKNGWPIIHATARLWDPAKYTVDEYVSMVAFFMETNVKRMDPSRPDAAKHFAIFDMKDMSFLKSDLKKIRQLLKIVSDYYPERLGVSVIINANLVTDYLWRFSQMLLDQRTIDKVRLFRDGYLDFLEEQIGLEHITTDIGGTRTEEWPLLSDEDTQDDYVW
eukprot:CAMPEP_0195292808 /NCGR_PEP_ID=MMETSP0707-20130614/10903_1 /TAXON_ID=33640 /ORGANISM="Asterionellopsis glacialis, Strain CCMP134" /LENGTH=258 /DNA_ID=CAMNT_0040353377 /DNA_START=63 /DNA_END=836 /DNA_ORIENTATION=-